MLVQSFPLHAIHQFQGPQLHVRYLTMHAGLMAFLASAAAGFITGQTISVDGGYSVMGFYDTAAAEATTQGGRF